MSIALSTLVFILLLTPGLFLRAFLIKSDALENPLDTSFKTELLIVLLFTIPIQLIGYEIITTSFDPGFDLLQFYYFLISDPKFDANYVLTSWRSFLIYQLILMLTSGFIGYAFRKLFIHYFLDLRFNNLPISNEWDNILSGRLSQFKRLKSIRKNRLNILLQLFQLNKQLQAKHQLFCEENINQYLNNNDETYLTIIRRGLLNQHQDGFHKIAEIIIAKRKLFNEDDHPALNKNRVKYYNSVSTIEKEYNRKIKLIRLHHDANKLSRLNQETKEQLDQATTDYQRNKGMISKQWRNGIEKDKRKLIEYYTCLKSYYTSRPRKIIERKNRYIVIAKTFKERRKIRKQIIDFIRVEILVQINNKTLIYRGELREYYLAKNNSLSKIILKNPRRVTVTGISQNILKENLTSETYGNFESDNFVIPFEQIKNINVLPIFVN